MGKYQSGQMGQTVNLLSFDFGGSNPSPPTMPKAAQTGPRPARPFDGQIAEVAQLVEH